MASPSIFPTCPKRAPPIYSSAWWRFARQYWLPALVLFFVCGPLLHTFPLHRYYPLDRYHNRGRSEYHASPVAMRRLQEGIAKCNSYNQTQPSNPEHRSLLRKNPRVSLTANETFIIRNAILFDGIKWTEDVVDVFISDGIIQAVNKSIHPDTLVNYEIDYEIDAMGGFLTPGLVDMHSHSTLYPLPATKDYIELFDLMSEGTEFVQVMDSIFPSDREHKISGPLYQPLEQLLTLAGYLHSNGTYNRLRRCYHVFDSSGLHQHYRGSRASHQKSSSQVSLSGRYASRISS